MLTQPSHPRHGAPPLAGLILLSTCLLPLPLLAAPTAFGPERESDVLALLQPFVDEGPLASGTRLCGIAIGARSLTLSACTEQGERATLTLTAQQPNPLRPPPQSFAVRASAPPSKSLREAQILLYLAVLSHDSGQFALAPAAEPAPAPAGPAPLLSIAAWWPADLLWRVWLAAALWLLALSALLARRDQCAGQPRQVLIALSLGILVFGAALWARLHAPFWVLHANDHAFEDLAIALREPATNLAGRHAALSYGASWTVAQQALVSLLGVHHDGVALASALCGAAAAALACGAAWSLSRSVWGALLGGLCAALAPMAVRVGHSESPLVVAQFLLAASLYLGTALPTRMTQAGLLACIGLLATGHPMGPGYAAAAALFAWALQPRNSQIAAAIDLRLGQLGRSALVVVLGFAAGLSQHSGVLHRRVGAIGLPGIRDVADLTLWLSDTWAPSCLWLLALVGMWGFGRRRAHQRWMRLGALGLGLGVLAWTSQITSACISDALRYQAAWAAPIAVLVACAPADSPCLHPAWRLTARVGVALLGAWIAWALLWPGRGATALDAQGQSYLALRRALAAERGDIALLIAEHQPDAPCLAAPVGRWTAQGPRVRALRADEARYLCARHHRLPPSTFVAIEPACAATVSGHRPSVCTTALPFAGASLGTWPTTPLRRDPGSGIAGEYLPFQAANPGLSLARARCPDP